MMMMMAWYCDDADDDGSRIGGRKGSYCWEWWTHCCLLDENRLPHGSGERTGNWKTMDGVVVG